jgi:O-antigen/teichoic acid export membrane protein
MIGLGSNFLIQVMTVRYLAVSEYGAFAYAWALASLGASAALLGMDKALGRFVPIYHERREYAEMAGSVWVVLASVTGAGTALVLLVFAVRGVIADSIASNALSVELLLILIFLTPLEALDTVFIKMFAIFTNPRALFFRRHVLAPALKFGAVASVMVFQGNVYFLAVANVVAGLLGVAISIVYLWYVLREQRLLRYFRLRSARPHAMKLFAFGVPLLTTDLVLLLRTSIVIFFLEFFHGTTGVAAFRSVLPVARLNLIVFESFKLLFVPTAARLLARQDRSAISQLYWATTAWIATLTFPVFAVSFALAQPVTVLLFGPQYSDSGVILAILSLGMYLNAAFGFNALTIRVLGNVRYIVAIDLLSAILALGMNLLLIPRYGAFGGALVTCGTLIVHNVLNQCVLVALGGVQRIPLRYVKVHLTIILAAGSLLLIEQIFAPPIPIGLVLAALGSLLVLRLNATSLDVATTFPELRRLAPLRHVLGFQGD